MGTESVRPPVLFLDDGTSSADFHAISPRFGFAGRPTRDPGSSPIVPPRTAKNMGCSFRLDPNIRFLEKTPKTASDHFEVTKNEPPTWSAASLMASTRTQLKTSFYGAANRAPLSRRSKRFCGCVGRSSPKKEGQVPDPRSAELAAFRPPSRSVGLR